MLRNWLQILPVFAYKWLARRYCASTNVHGLSWSCPAPDVLIMTSSKVDKMWRLPLLQVGDEIIRKEDWYLKPHHTHARHGSYPNNRRFTAGKAYQIVRVRAKKGVVFVIDDGGFCEAITPFQMRLFDVSASKLATAVRASINNYN